MSSRSKLELILILESSLDLEFLENGSLSSSPKLELILILNSSLELESLELLIFWLN